MRIIKGMYDENKEPVWGADYNDIKSAVEWLLEEIRKRPNRDDSLTTTNGTIIMKIDGGGIGKFEVGDLIKEAFEDVNKDE